MNDQALQLHFENSRSSLDQWAAEGRLYALIDPFFELPMVTERKRLDTRDTDPVFFEVIAWDQVSYEAPSLVHVTPDVLSWLLNTLSTERWGLFLVSDAGLENLTRYFQKFVIAKGPDANPYFLRFHDPSVLEVLLRTWDTRERAIFFGPCLAFGLPDLDSMDVRIERNPFSVRLQALPRPEDCLLQLRETQLQACSEAIDRDLVKVIYWHLRNHHSKAVQHLDRSTLQRRVQFAIHKARRYALGTISDLAGFAALMFELAPNFDEHPSFKRVLLDGSLPPEAKMRRLSQVITDREWEEALRLYDRNFWASVLKAEKKRS